MPAQRHTARAGGAARDQQAVAALFLQGASKVVQVGSGPYRDHPLQHLGLAVIALEGAGSSGDRDRQEAARVLRPPLRGLPALEAGCVELHDVGEVGAAHGECLGRAGAGGRDSGHSASTPSRRYLSTRAAKCDTASVPVTRPPSSSSAASLSISTSQAAYGLSSTAEGRESTASFLAATVPVSGERRGPTNFSASIEPSGSPRRTCVPTVTRASWARVPLVSALSGSRPTRARCSPTSSTHSSLWGS